LRAGVSLNRLPDVCETGLVVAAGLDPAQVPAVPVRSRDELPLLQRLVRDHLDFRAERSERPAARAEGGLDLIVGRWPEGAAQDPEQLRFAEPVVAANEREHDSS